MNTDYIWEKGLFKNNYYLYEHGIHVGDLIHTKYGREAQVLCNLKKFVLSTKGILNFKTTLKDANGVKIGSIRYNLFTSSAKIHYNNKVIKIRNYGLFDSRWIMSEGSNTLVKFNGSKEKGIIETQNHDEKLIICGLYIANIFWRLRFILGFLIIAFLWVNFIIAML